MVGLEFGDWQWGIPLKSTTIGFANSASHVNTVLSFV